MEDGSTAKGPSQVYGFSHPRILFLAEWRICFLERDFHNCTRIAAAVRSPDTPNYLASFGVGGPETIHIHPLLLHALGVSHKPSTPQLTDMDHHSLHRYQLTGWFRCAAIDECCCLDSPVTAVRLQMSKGLCSALPFAWERLAETSQECKNPYHADCRGQGYEVPSDCGNAFD
jgi:hypothetical protein